MHTEDIKETNSKAIPSTTFNLTQTQIKRLNTLRKRIADDTKEIGEILGKAGDESQPVTGKRKVFKHVRKEEAIQYLLGKKVKITA